MVQNQSSLSADIHRQVFEIYREVEAEIAAAGPVCESSGRCCRFKEYGHTLFISNLEADVLLAAAPAYSQPVSADFCPFQQEKLCTAREPRPLGCRVFFCDPTYQETAHALTEKYLVRLKEIARQNDLDWRYAPLHVFLNEAERPAAPALVAPPSERVPLPMVEAGC